MRIWRLPLALAVAVLAAGCASNVQRDEMRGATPNPRVVERNLAGTPVATPLAGQASGELGVAGACVGNSDALVFRVPFMPGAARLTLSAGAERALLAAARRGEQVQLRDSFDGVRPAGFSPQLTAERMHAVRTFLTAHGVAHNRIEVVKRAELRSTAEQGGMEDDAAIEIVVLLPVSVPGS